VYLLQRQILQMLTQFARDGGAIVLGSVGPATVIALNIWAARR
jgi:hypothetical protein